jgi:hypothetical protein
MLSILLPILFILATSGLTYVLYNMIQPGNLLEGWQNVLDKVYSYSRFLEMFIGGCDKCFANMLSQISFIIYLIVQYNTKWLGLWNILIWFVYFSSCIILSVFIINYLRNLGKVSDLEERIKKLEDVV